LNYFEPQDAALVPRFAGTPSFFRLPMLDNPAEVDVALVGVPFDGGTTNRAGARHGPREIRNQSSLMRRINANGVSPYDRLRVADLGDSPVNPINLLDALNKIKNFLKLLPMLALFRSPPVVTISSLCRFCARWRGSGLWASFILTRIPTQTISISAITPTPMARHSAAPLRKDCWTRSAPCRSAIAAPIIMSQTGISPALMASASSPWTK
jgi:hypothetical protein